MIAGISALCLIFLIMLLITRSFVASLVIVGTVALSLGASFGLSVIIWQYILGIELHWLVMQMAIIVPHRAILHDAGRRHLARSLVLVASECAHAPVASAQDDGSRRSHTATGSGGPGPRR
ncbi:putative membrane protein, MmpL [Mycobacteroides abscessus subsp. abscessus]|nr:putative membrane protein, MmpL [Mycobacteroides abscessus subsp. abscessus]